MDPAPVETPFKPRGGKHHKERVTYASEEERKAALKEYNRQWYKANKEYKLAYQKDYLSRKQGGPRAVTPAQ